MPNEADSCKVVYRTVFSRFSWNTLDVYRHLISTGLSKQIPNHYSVGLQLLWCFVFGLCVAIAVWWFPTLTVLQLHKPVGDRLLPVVLTHLNKIK